MEQENKVIDNIKTEVGYSIGSNSDIDNIKKNKVGRPKLKLGEKIIYQRIAFEVPVYIEFRKLIDNIKKESPNITISQIQMLLINNYIKDLSIYNNIE